MNDLDWFNQLTYIEKYNMILATGALIAERLWMDQHFKFYSLGEFFVEISYLPNSTKIDKIEGFELDDGRLDEYINSNIQH